MDENEQRLINSWNNNASSWTRVIRNQQIESRVLVTNSAILETVIELNPKTFLDVGCGEGWLCREFFSKGIEGWESMPRPNSLRQRSTRVIRDFLYLYIPT
ncbi:MAG: hypothetical protein AB1589_00095 [Cyanobacteriota bacterium]